MRLPYLPSIRWKYPAGIMMFGLAYLFYYFTNHHPIFIPQELWLTPADNLIPFVPWTVLIYISEYLFFTATYLCCRNAENLSKYLYSFFFTQVFSCLIFLLWPTTYPRELFPVPVDTAPFLTAVWQWLRNQDAATNCFPSLHVSTVFLSAYIFRDEKKYLYRFFMIWGTLIAISTLPTKQHYIVDVIAGFFLSGVAYWIFHKKVKYYKIEFKEKSYQAN